MSPEPNNPWAITPKTMDATRLAEMQADTTALLTNAPAGEVPMVPASELHAALSYIEHRQERLQQQSNDIAEVAQKLKDENAADKAEHVEALGLLNNTVLQREAQITSLRDDVQMDKKRISELETALDEAKAGPNDLRPGDPANPVPM